MKYISRVVEIDAERIKSVHPHINNSYEVVTDEGRVMKVVSSQKVEAGDYLNVTDPKDIYHMPAKIIDGPNAKYMKL